MLKRKTFKDIGVLTIGGGLQIVAQIMSIRIATSLMTPSNLGTVNQIISISSLFCSALIAPVSLYIGRGFVEWCESGVLTKYLLQFMKYVFLVTIFSVSVAWILQVRFQLVGEVSPLWVILLVGVYVLAYSIHEMGVSGLNLLGHRVEFVTFSNLATWAGLGCASILFLVFLQPVYWILGRYLGIAIACSSLFVLLKYLRNMPRVPVVGKRENAVLFKRSLIVHFAWPQMITLVLWWIQSQSYRFILDRLTGLANVGLFTVGYGVCAMPMKAFETLFNQFYSPTYYRNLKMQDINGRARAWNDYSSAYIPAIILVGTFLIGSGPFLAKILLGEKFQSVSEFLIWPALTETMRAIGSTLHFMGIAKVDMKIMIFPVAVGAIMVPFGIYLFAPIHPLYGTAIAMFLASVGVLLVVILTSYRKLPIHWPLQRILWAGLLGLPMVIGFKVTSRVMPQVTILGAIVVLLVGGFYLLLSQYVLAKEWIGEAYREKGVTE